MTYKALDIAKWFINHFDRESGDLITHLKVQKLLYYAEAWSQLMLGRELFAEPIQAWAHGPVVPEVFHEFKQFGWNSIGPMEMDTVIDPEVADVLGQVLQIYGDFPAKTLENMTHADTPWIEARGALAPEERCESVISKEKIREYFRRNTANFWKMKKSLPKQKIREEASVVRVSPKEKKIFDLIDCEASKPDSVLNKNPYVVLKYFQEKWQCFSDWEKDELKQFTGFLQHFAQYTWDQVYKSGSKIPKHGLAYTKYDTAEIRSGAKAHLDRVKSQISEDINFFELRVNQEKLRVHGFQSQTGFFLVLLDREHSVFPM